MTNMLRFTWLRSRLTSVMGLRVCIGGDGRGYCVTPFRSQPHSSVPSRTQVPYKITAKDMLEKWEKEFLNNLRRDSPQYKKYMQNTKKLLDDFANRPQIATNKHVRTTQLLDVLSVTLHSTTSKDDGCEKELRPFQIYGNIQLLNIDDNYTYDVFRRRCNNPQTVLPGTNLLLTVPKESHAYMIVPMASAYKLRLNLKDAATDGKVIAKGDFDFQMLGDKFGFREKTVTKVVPSRNGTSAYVHYAILPYGVVATVQLTLTKINQTGSDQSESSDAHIYGCISATTKAQQGSVISSVLFDKPPCDPMMVNLGTPIEIGRPNVAVPAYSSLQIKADLWDQHTNQQIASDAILANFQAEESNTTVQTCLLGQNYHARVRIFWNNADELLEQGEKPLDELQSSQSASSASSYRGIQLSNGLFLASIIGAPMLEVFSITVSPNSDANSNICGTVEVYDSKSFGGQGNPFVVFGRDVSNPESLSGDMKIKSSSMRWPVSPFEGESFLIRLQLSDDEGRQVCHGYIDWDAGSVEHCGKLMSSVILGKHGYATVHYAMLPNAIHAEVHALFRPKPCTQYQYLIMGNISAWYSSTTCSTCSEKKFFRSTLLSEDDPEIVFSGCPLRMDKKSVAVPLKSSLILGMKFEVGVVGRTSEGRWFSKHYGSMDQVVDFEIDVVGEQSEKTIAGEGFNIDVVIKWVEVDRYVKLKHFRTLREDLKRRIQEA